MFSLMLSITTLILVAGFIAGKFWRVAIMKSTFGVQYACVSTFENKNLIDLSNGNSKIFSICSNVGIRKITVHKDVYHDDGRRLEMIAHTLEDIGPMETIYVKVNAEGNDSVCFVEILRNDYVKNTFRVLRCGKDTPLTRIDNRVKMTTKGWIYHICG